MSLVRSVKVGFSLLLCSFTFLLFQNFNYPKPWNYPDKPIILAMNFAANKEFAYVAEYLSDSKLTTLYKVNLKNGQRSIVTQYSNMRGGPQKGNGPKNLFDPWGVSEYIPRSIQVDSNTGNIYVFSAEDRGSDQFAHFTKIDPKTGDRTQVNLKNMPEQFPNNLKNPQISFFNDGGRTAVVRINLTMQRHPVRAGEQQLPWSPFVWGGACFHLLNLKTGVFSKLQQNCVNDDAPGMDRYYHNVYFGQPTLSADETKILYFNMNNYLEIDIESNNRRIIRLDADMSWMKKYYENFAYTTDNPEVRSVTRVAPNVYELVVKNDFWDKNGKQDGVVYDLIRINLAEKKLVHIQKLNKIPKYMRTSLSQSGMTDANHLHFSVQSKKVIFGGFWEDFTVYNYDTGESTNFFKK